MKNDDDGLSILTDFVSGIENRMDFSNSKVFEKFMMTYPSMDIYKKYHQKLSKQNNDDPNLNSLLFSNLFLMDLQNYIAHNQQEIMKTHQFRLGAIGKITLRQIEITDENLALLRNGYGTSVISNLRLMLESYAIAKYLMNTDDMESDKFQDFGIVQECKIHKTDPRIKLSKKGYSDDLFDSKSDFAWVSDKKIKTPIDFINRLDMEEINDWYKFFCKYVHASPYSCGKVHQMNQSSMNNKNAYMPISMENLIQQNKYYITLFIELLADSFILDEMYRELFKKISLLIYEFKK
ncbi:MAG: hypothetical protein IJ158_13605 [Treponema sp.]|nr:hypothetical protein [Treponema sp.]